MRSPEELIRELKLEGEKFDTVAILVVFENDTLPVYSIDTEALENLKELIQKGGEPIGLIFLTSRGEGIAYGTRPFQEYAKEDWAIARLQGYIERLTKFMEADGVQTFPYPTKNQKESTNGS